MKKNTKEEIRRYTEIAKKSGAGLAGLATVILSILGILAGSKK